MDSEGSALIAVESKEGLRMCMRLLGFEFGFGAVGLYEIEDVGSPVRGRSRERGFCGSGLGRAALAGTVFVFDLPLRFGNGAGSDECMSSLWRRGVVYAASAFALPFPFVSIFTPIPTSSSSGKG